MEYKKPKGTQDILPSQSANYQFIEKIAREVASQFGYKEIRTPMFEETSLFQRNVGESSDIVSKEMYTFEDKGGRSMTLRPEMTAGAARACVENGLFNEMLPQKLFYLAQNFRYENPQAGRYREFSQFGIESYGVDNPFAEIEVMGLAQAFFKRLGITNYKIHINSVGCPECRAKFNQAFKKFGEQHKDELCDDCKRRINTNPMRMLDCKSAKCQELFKQAPTLQDCRCEDCRRHFDEVKQLMIANGLEYVEDANLVRGLDYYTRTVFEFICDDIDGTGRALTICGGGRYDNLIDEIGGIHIPCVGFGIGIDRLILMLNERYQNNVDLYIMNVGDVSVNDVYPLVSKLRNDNVKVDFNLMKRGFKPQFKFAEKIGAKYVCIIGDEELQSQKYTLKELATGVEQKLSYDEIKNIFSK